MRPISVRLAASGSTPWVILDYLQRGFAVGLAVVPSSNSNGTYTVQHTLDNPNKMKYVSVSRAGTVATLVLANHGMSVADSVNVIAAGDPNLNGTFDVASVVDQNTLTYTVGNTGATTDQGVTRASLVRVFPHSTLVTQTVRKDGNYEFPPLACRLLATGLTAGYIDLDVIQGYARG